MIVNERLTEHLLAREEFTWGSYGKEGDQPLKITPLSKMSNAHIQAILDTQPHIYERDYLPALFNYELGYRAGKGIHVEDTE